MKRFGVTIGAIVLGVGLYLVSYRFSGVALLAGSPNMAQLHVFGVPLPSTPQVARLYTRFYWPLIVRSAERKPPLKIIGTVSDIDLDQSTLTIERAPRSGILCHIRPAQQALVRGFKIGDPVSALFGHTPDPVAPCTWSYHLISMEPR